MREAASCSASRAWAGMAVGLALGALSLWYAPREVLDWQAASAWSQPWRLLTAAGVHLSPLHLQANLLGCAVVGMFGVMAGVPRRAAWAWLAAWPLTHAALALNAQLLHYAGLSGVLHAGVAVAALDLACRRDSRQRAIGVAVLAGLAVKLMLERPWLGPAQAVPGWDMPIVPLAHLTGAVAGMLCGAAVQAIAGRDVAGLG